MLSVGVSPAIFPTGSARSARRPQPSDGHLRPSRALSGKNWIASGLTSVLLSQLGRRRCARCKSSSVSQAKSSETLQSKVLAVVGLGNVGSQYVGTRHNIGFAAVDEVATKLLDGGDSGWALDGSIWESAHGGNLLRLKRGKTLELGAYSELVLFKPASMMNGSGLPVSQLMDAHPEIPESQLVVIYDDLDLEVGRLRLRKSGSAGGQNGVRSILAHGFKDFLRMRLGISRPPKSAGRNGVVGHVLGRFRHEELDSTGEALRLTAAAIEDLADGMTIDNVMNKFNRALVTAS